MLYAWGANCKIRSYGVQGNKNDKEDSTSCVPVSFCCHWHGVLNRSIIYQFNLCNEYSTSYILCRSCSSADNSLLNQSSLTPWSNSQVQKSILLCHAEKLPSHAILSLTVHDPRDLPSSRTEVTDNEFSTILEGYLQGEDSLWSRPETNGIFLSDSISLWDCSNNLNPPVPESIICKEKHDRRLKDFYLEPSSHAGASTEVKDCPSRTCPILLLKHADYGSYCMGWDATLLSISCYGNHIILV